MGCGESISTAAAPDFNGRIQERAVTKLDDNFSKQEFHDARNSLQMAEAKEIFTALAKDLTGKPPYTSVPPSLNKACFICCNTYQTVKYALGVGPMNDSITVAKNHKDRGYQVFFLHNPTADEFLQFLPLFLKRTKDELTIFYTGHGASVKDKNGDESDGFDEAMVFDKGHIIDDKLVQILQDNANGKTRILLLTDCCHSGSIWDIQSAEKHNIKLPGNIISVSAAKDAQTAKQTTIGNKSQGIFTYFFWKTLNANPTATPDEIANVINGNLKRFNQFLVCAETTPAMAKQPLFHK